MNPPSPVTLQGDVVALEPLSLEHVPALAEIALDSDLWRWTLSVLRSPEDVLGYVQAALAAQAEGSALPFAIRHLATGRLAGSTRYGNIDVDNQRLEICWTWVARAWQRTAVNTAAKYLLLRHAFEVLECARVELKTDALNQRSRTAIRRIGASEEGVLRRHMLRADGRLRDTVYYSILADEWPGVRDRLLERLAPG